MLSDSNPKIKFNKEIRHDGATFYIVKNKKDNSSETYMKKYINIQIQGFENIKLKNPRKHVIGEVEIDVSPWVNKGLGGELIIISSEALKSQKSSIAKDIQLDCIL